ncbi:hypothetical protein LCGC14_2274540 [marine sediment metagenome]|uniref:Uncharacterized protein n=1 Tax=marine sediment metagenome TaxID=412755 RepID=A0A0F9CW60_9ZZZZ
MNKQLEEIRERANAYMTLADLYVLLEIVDTQAAQIAEGREIVLGFTQFQPEEQTDEMFDEADKWLKEVSDE